ncbi:hypothetical protein [Priestia abyssalis]|uniref:hypothetical protein n=1 Tax=Priestia abyssalis TaxID=1221450 RepID=UPI000994D47E|nr:hypothetical protein [Priestia abyssalis]
MNEYVQHIIERLNELPNLLFDKRMEYQKYCRRIQEIKLEISKIEVDLYNNDQIEVRNELTRTASILPHTQELHEHLISIEYSAQKKKHEYDLLKHEMENLRCIGQLLISRGESI